MKRYGLSAQKTGLPPGTLVHVGQLRSEQAVLSSLQYTASEVQEQTVPLSDVGTLAGRQGIVWVHLSGISQVNAVERLGAVFGIHALALEDVLNTNQRPKLEDYGHYIYVAIKMLHYKAGSSEVLCEHINLILGQDFVLSFQESQEPFFATVRERIKNSPGRFYQHGAGYLAYTLMDTIIDHYFVVLEQLGERIEAVEDLLIKEPQDNLLPAIHELKSELLFLRRSVWPLREVVAGMERSGSPLFTDGTLMYIRDVYDHTVQVIETLEAYRDMTGSMVDIYLSGVSNRMNEVVKMLTAISTIFMPLTFLAGLYGMNFKHMPETEWTYSYPAVVVIMAAIGLSMYRYFKNKHWI